MTEQHSGSGDVSRSLALLWDYDEAVTTKGPKPQLTLEAIVDAAIELADTEGLDALSMRRVAQALGVGTMSLYRYVPGKDELFDLMLDRVTYVQPGASLGDHWREAMETMARGMWELYTSHRWLPLVDQARPIMGPNAMASLEVALAGLVGSGLDDQERVAVIVMIDAFVQSAARNHNSGYLAEQRTGVTAEEFWKAQEPVMVRAMESGRFPQMAGLAEDSFQMSGEAFFEFGLQRQLDGLAVLVDGRSGSTS